MAFLIPLAAGALGLGAVGTAVLEIGAAVGLGLAASKLSKKPKSKSSGGRSLSLQIAADEPRVVVLGERTTAGSLKYWQLYGRHNKFLQMVIKLADHECDGLSGIVVDGKLKSIDVDGYVEGYADKFHIEFFSGTSTQAACASVIANSDGRWTADDRGLNVCYAVATIEIDEKLFPDLPQMLFVLRGFNKLVHPSTGSLVYSASPPILIWNVLRGIKVNGLHLLGMNVPAVAIRAADTTAAISACAEPVTLAAGGTEPRYVCGLVIDTDMTNRDVLQPLIDSMAGDLIEAGGIYRIMAGVSRTPVMSLDDMDIITAKPFVTDPKRPRSALVNAVSGSFADPRYHYKMMPLPARSSSEDAAADGGIVLWQDNPLEAVSSGTQGQRILEIKRRIARRQLIVSGTFCARTCALEPGDWITLNSNRRGYSERTFEVAGLRGAPDCQVELDLAEVDSTIDDWSTALEISDDEVTDLLSAGPYLADVEVLTLTPVTVYSPGGRQTPGLHMTWTAIDDPTVTGIDVEFRRIGDTDWLKAGTSNDPQIGTYVWTSGVQGATPYEGRALPITTPRRAVDWSAPVATATDTPDHVVGVALSATSVPPGTITEEMMDALSAFRIGLINAGAEIQGSVDERLQTVAAQIATISETAQRLRQSITSVGGHVQTVATEAASADFALAEQINSVTARLDTGDIASFIETITSRVGTVEDVAGGRNRTFHQADAPIATAVGDLWVQTDEGNTLYVATEVGTAGWVYAGDGRITSSASQLVTITTRVGDLEGETFDLNQSIGGVLAQRVIGVDVNGHAAVVQINGTSLGSNITFSAEGFHFTDSRINGGEGFSLIVPELVGGVWQAYIDGNLLVRSITANSAAFGSLSAINATLGDVEFGRLISQDGAATLDGELQKWSNTAGSYLDMKTGRLLLKGAA